MSILRTHGINTVTKENIAQVTSLLQSLDIPFDLLGKYSSIHLLSNILYYQKNF
jgi:hypothetical protein